LIQPDYDFKTFPTLETSRLILRELLETDTDAVFIIRGDIEVTRHNIGAPYTDVEQARELIRNIKWNYPDLYELRWGIALKDDPAWVIGMCGYNYWIRKDERASIGYDLAQSHWGRGIMTEALRAIIRFGFDHMKLHRVEADVSADNPASMRVLEKLGFKFEGRLREQYWDWGDYHDLLLYALLQPEFERGEP
jgi:ribosomal-protein-alanine N-acetyltransferase